MATVALSEIIKEGNTAFYTCRIRNESGLDIDVAELESLTLTHYDLRTEEIINNRDEQNVLQANNVTVETTSEIIELVEVLTTILTWELQPLDTVLVDSRRELETHIALFHWTWNSGTRAGSHEISFQIENLTYHG